MPVSIEDIREKIERDAFEFTNHAVDRMILRNVSVQEVREAIASAEVIEDYPDDKYGPSCLLFGQTRDTRALHIQCTYPSRLIIKVITVYEPDPNEWIDYRKRRGTNDESPVE